MQPEIDFNIKVHSPIEKNEIKTQKDAILYHLQTFRTITSWEAIKEYGATRLSGIIYQLRKEGYDITAIDTKAKNRFGNSVTYATYKLIPNDKILPQVQ